jgi:hypothetical protein
MNEELDAIVDRLLKNAITDCCRSQLWRGRLCEYHEGFAAGAEAFAKHAESHRDDILRAFEGHQGYVHRDTWRFPMDHKKEGK